MIAAEPQAQLNGTSAPSPNDKQKHFALPEVFTNGKQTTSNMREHPRVQKTISLDEPPSPAIAKKISSVVDPGAQANIWSLREYLQARFKREQLTPASHLLAATHSPIPITGTFPAIIEGKTDGSPAIQCRTDGSPDTR